MGGIILPKTYVANIEEPIIFLAGPIRSAPNWQDDAIKCILNKNSNLTVASPRRGIRENISKYVLKGNETYFSRQREWELHYLHKASKNGSILFWLCGEEEHNCNKVYGAMTRVEIGEWMAHYNHDRSLHFCVGSDSKFSELHTVEYDLKHYAPDKQIIKAKNSICALEKICDEAIRLSFEN